MHEVMNLLPWREAYQRHCQWRLLIMLSLLITSVMLSIYLPFMWFQHEKLQLQNEQYHWQEKARQLQPKYKKWQVESQHDRQVKSDFYHLSQRIHRHNQPVVLMNKMPKLLPQGTHLESMRWFQQQIEIVGATDNKAALQQLVSALQAIPEFERVTLSSVMVTKRQPVEHVFKLKIDQPRESADEVR